MSGFIKFTLRDYNKTITTILNISVINGFLSDYANIFENDIDNIIYSEQVKKSRIFESSHYQFDTLTPFNYGYIFIDRINKTCFFLNNYDSISYFSNFNFNNDDYLQLKKQNFKIKITNFPSKKSNSKDVRKEFVSRDFREYRKLFTSLPYVKTIESIDTKIKDISTLESILDELMDLRSKRNQTKEEFVNDLIIKEFKDWIFIEDNADESSFNQLFKYLQSKNLLSEKEIQIWNDEINKIKDI